MEQNSQLENGLFTSKRSHILPTANDIKIMSLALQNVGHKMN